MGHAPDHGRSHHGDRANLIARYIFAFIRLLQLVAAVATIGYYASDLCKPSEKLPVKYNGTEWLYSIVVSSLAALTALILLIFILFVPFFVITVTFVWEWVLVILLSAVAGMMCTKYYRAEPTQATDWDRMRIATGFACASLGLWFITAAIGFIDFLIALRRAVQDPRQSHGRSKV